MQAAMMNDALLKYEGMNVLSERLGLIGAERFVMLMRREPFDYTEWRRGLYKDQTLEELCENVKQFEAAQVPRDTFS